MDVKKRSMKHHVVLSQEKDNIRVFNKRKLGDMNFKQELKDEDEDFDKSIDSNDEMPTQTKGNTIERNIFMNDPTFKSFKTKKDFKDLNEDDMRHLRDLAKQTSFKTVNNLSFKLPDVFKMKVEDIGKKFESKQFENKANSILDLDRMLQINEETHEKHTNVINGNNDMNFRQVERIQNPRFLQDDKWKKILPDWSKDLRSFEMQFKKYYKKKKIND